MIGGCSPLLKQPRCYSGECFLGELHGWSLLLSFRDK